MLIEAKNQATQNYLRTVEFKYPEWIPCEIRLLPAVWHKYREKLEELVLRHPLVFRDCWRGRVFPGQLAAFGIMSKGEWWVKW